MEIGSDASRPADLAGRETPRDNDLTPDSLGSKTSTIRHGSSPALSTRPAQALPNLGR